MAHSRAEIAVREPLAQNALNPDNERTHWVLLPANARRQYASLVEKQSQLLSSSEKSPYNKAESTKAQLGVIACGIAYNYVMENEPQKLGVPVLKVSQYPLPEQTIKEFAAQCDSLLIAEDGQPMVEEQVKSLLGAEYVIKGRLTGDLPRMGELTPDSVGKNNIPGIGKSGTVLRFLSNNSSFIPSVLYVLIHLFVSRGTLICFIAP